MMHHAGWFGMSSGGMWIWPVVGVLVIVLLVVMIKKKSDGS